ncbi:response regulator transcription factor [Knoellia subterranea]|uniref:LuxR family transcriptional regulator n=1 Tax=Knoellia subterranea KCTC 19937 TaxID=1385521 RepID=A0A0A0JHW1_9MICO|nr:response regulator transcription factor [Knoellia subterranea]KGN36334.1 LuxR family transcriptional regulator [Knoellia subterranea KCTC 19937]
MTIRVLVVDDDALTCGALRSILGSADDVEVVASVEDGDEVMEAVHRHRPDVILMDVRMRRQDGISATAALQSLTDPPRVIVLTTYEHDNAVMRALEAGATSFLLKSAGPQEIIGAVRAVAAGDSVLSPGPARQVIEQLLSDPARERRVAAEGLVATLTPREVDVVRAVGHGMTNAEAARSLFMGEATVKSHLSSAQLKLGVQSRTQVAVLAERAGLL